MTDIKTKRDGGWSNDMHVERAKFSHPFLSWRSILGGLLVAALTSAVLMTLGIAFGAASIVGGVNSSPSEMGLISGAWSLGSVLLSLFAGGYFAARVSKFNAPAIGSAQGLVLAALFFVVFLMQAGAVVGWMARATGQAVAGAAGVAGAGVAGAAQIDAVRATVEDAIGDLNLKGSPDAVLTGVGSRLLRGDAQGAKIYLARQADIAPAEADRRIAEASAKIELAGRQLRDGAARGLQTLAWSLFLAMLMGAAAAVGGGALGCRLNERRPMALEQSIAQHDLAMSSI